MNLLGTDFSQSARGEFIQSPNADRGIPYRPGIFAVAASVFVRPSSPVPQVDYAFAASKYAIIRSQLMAEPFPTSPGITRVIYGSNQGAGDYTEATAASSRTFFAKADGSWTESPMLIGGTAELTSGVWSTTYITTEDNFISDGAGGRIPTNGGLLRIGVTKTMIVFGGQFPYPNNGRFCIYDASYTSPTYFGTPAEWFLRRIDPELNTEGLTLSKRRVIIPPPTALEFYGGNYYAARRNDRGGIPVSIRRVRTENSPPDVPGSTLYPPAPASCAN